MFIFFKHLIFYFIFLIYFYFHFTEGVCSYLGLRELTPWPLGDLNVIFKLILVIDNQGIFH